MIDDELQRWKTWSYPSPFVTRAEAAMILGDPVASWLDENEPPPDTGRWILIDDKAAEPLYTIIEEKPE